MIYLITYDISENAKRDRIAKKLLEYGLIRIQYSVFIGRIKLTRIAHLKNWLLYQLNAQSNVNKIFIVKINRAQLKSHFVIGDYSDIEWDEILGSKRTIYID